MPKVLSVNIGAPRPNPAKKNLTGIHKQPIEQAELRVPGPKRGGLGGGLIGDFIGDREHHGGDQQAVYAVAREQLDWWGRQLRRPLDNGVFGENLTTQGFDPDRALVGERWRIGD